MGGTVLEWFHPRAARTRSAFSTRATTTIGRCGRSRHYENWRAKAPSSCPTTSIFRWPTPCGTTFLSVRPRQSARRLAGLRPHICAQAPEGRTAVARPQPQAPGARRRHASHLGSARAIDQCRHRLEHARRKSLIHKGWSARRRCDLHASHCMPVLGLRPYWREGTPLPSSMSAAYVPCTTWNLVKQPAG